MQFAVIAESQPELIFDLPGKSCIPLALIRALEGCQSGSLNFSFPAPGLCGVPTNLLRSTGCPSGKR